MILASDFDGTIFIDGKISEKDIKAIRDFQEAGNLFAIVTGRAFASLFPLIDGKIYPDAIICNNGGHIFVRKKERLEEVFKASISKAKAKSFLDIYSNEIPNGMAIFTENTKQTSLSKVDEDIMALAIYSDDKIPNHFPEYFDFHFVKVSFHSIGQNPILSGAATAYRYIPVIFSDYIGRCRIQAD